MVGSKISVRDRGDGLACIVRGCVDLVVDIREVASICDLPETPLQQAIEPIEDNSRSGITDMGEVVNGRPSHVHRDVIGVGGCKSLFVARQGIGQA